MFRILVINPGSTSTKIAVYEDEAPLFVESRDHDTAKLSPAVMEQFELRHRLLLDVLTEKGIDPASLHACVGRGGLLPPVRSGAYRVNDAMLDVLRHRPVMQTLGPCLRTLWRGRSASRRSSMIPSPWTKWIPSPASPGFRP